MDCKYDINVYFIPLSFVTDDTYLARTTNMSKELRTDLPDTVLIRKIPNYEVNDNINAVSLIKKFDLSSKFYGCMYSNESLYLVMKHEQYGRGKLMVLDLTVKYPELALGPVPLQDPEPEPELKPLMTYEESKPTLDGMPAELVLKIIENLDCSDVISLAHTNQRIRDIIITYIKYIYAIMPTTYPGIKDIILQSDITYSMYMQICSLIKNKYVAAYSGIMQSIAHKPIPRKYNKLYKYIKGIIDNEPVASLFYSYLFNVYIGPVSYTEFVLLLVYIKRRLTNPVSYEYGSEVIGRYRNFKFNNPTIQDSDEFMLLLLITEGASYSFAYTTIANISLKINKNTLYRRWLVLLNLFKLHDGQGMEILTHIVNDYSDTLIQRLKDMQTSGIDLRDLYKIRMKVLKNLDHKQFKRLLELYKYKIVLPTILTIIVDVDDTSYDYLIELLDQGIVIEDAMSVTSLVKKHTQVTVYLVLVKKKGINHNDAYVYISRMKQHNAKEIQQQINQYTKLLKNGITSTDAHYLITYLTDEQLDLAVKYKDQLVKAGIPVTNLFKYKIFVDVDPVEWEKALQLYIKSHGSKT
jgi:hypothetical protein